MDLDKAENEIKENTKPEIPSIAAAPVVTPTAPAAPIAAPITAAAAPTAPVVTLASTRTAIPALSN